MQTRDLNKEYEIYKKLKSKNIYDSFWLSFTINTVGFIIILYFLKSNIYDLSITKVLLTCVLSLPVNWIMTSIIGFLHYIHYIKNKESLLNKYSKKDILLNNAISNFSIYRFINNLEKDLTLEEIKNINKFIKEYDYYKVNREKVASFEEYEDFFSKELNEELKKESYIINI